MEKPKVSAKTVGTYFWTRNIQYFEMKFPMIEEIVCTNTLTQLLFLNRIILFYQLGALLSLLSAKRSSRNICRFCPILHEMCIHFVDMTYQIVFVEILIIF